MLKWLLHTGVVVLLFCVRGWTAPGDIMSVTIDPTGWRAEIVIAGLPTGGTYNLGIDTARNNDPANAKCVFRVQRPGYGDAAQPATLLDTVYATVALRQPFPNSGTKAEDANSGNVRVRVVLSEYIHVRDVVRCDLAAGLYTAGTASRAASDLPCVNASQEGYASPVGNWTYPDRTLITNDTLTAQCFVVHRSGRNGRPVACVIFSATDEAGHTVRDTVRVPSVNPGRTDAVPVCEYWAKINVSSLRNGDKITLNFKAYPWVGDVVLSSADATVSRDQVFYLDRTASYGRAYAFVSNSGNNGTGVASMDSAAAYAAPFADLGTALKACENYSNTHFSRNNADNCVVYLLAGTHHSPGTFLSLANTNSRVWTEVRGYPGHSQDDIKLVPDPDDVWSRKIGSLYTRLSHLTVLQNSDTWVTYAPTTQYAIWLDKMKLAGYGPATSWYWAIYDYSCVYITHSQIDSTIAANASIIRGNTMAGIKSLSYVSTIVGNRIDQRSDGAHILFRGAAENGVLAYNQSYKCQDQWLSHSSTNTVFGLAVVGNMAERVGNGPGAMICIGGYGTALRNVIVWNNTFAGNRYLGGYCEVSADEKYVLCSHKNSTYDYFANKVDNFAQNGTHVGGWPITNGVGCSGNMILRKPFNQEFTGLHCRLSPGTAAVFGYKNDQSMAGGNTGDGDYSMDGTGQGVQLTADITMPLDITGAPYHTAGAAGAYEYAASAPTGVARPSITPNGASFDDSVQVSLSCGTAGATIRYTTNNLDPTSTSLQYTAPFWLKSSVTLKARGFKSESGLTDSPVASAVFTKSAPQSPFYDTAFAVPCIIRAEDFDLGGANIAYYDITPTNQGNKYRTTEGVDVETLVTGGYIVGFVSAGEWLEYTVQVASAGNYDIDCRVASAGSNGSFHIEFGGVNKTGAITVPNTGSWDTYQTVGKTGIALSAGRQVMRVVFDAVGSKDNGVANLDYINIVQSLSVVIDPRSSGINKSALSHVSPNPMRGRVTFALPENAGANSRVEIFGRDGRVVYDNSVEAVHAPSLQWDGIDMTGHRVNPGIYFYTVTTNGRQETGRIMVLPHE